MRVCPTCYALFGSDQTHCPTDRVATVDHAQVLIGKELGPYIVRSLVSEGGMGVVYAGEHPTLGRRVALKVLRPEFSIRDDIVERFTLEAKAVNLIGHANIVNIYDFGTTPYGSFYIVMEYIDGHTLRHVLEDAGPLRLRRIRMICEALGDALLAAHQKGFVHRDVKPENVMVGSRSGRPFVKLLDFGITKLLTSEAGMTSQTGAAMGTPQYMSPEQLEDEKLDHRTDVYAMGVLMYEMLTGDVPYPHRSHAAVRQRQLTQAPTAPSLVRRNIGISRSLDAAVLKAMSLDPEQRFGDMKQFMRAFRKGVDDSLLVPAPGGTDPADKTISVLPTAKRPKLVLLALAVTAVILGTTLALVLKKSTAGQPAKTIDASEATNGKATADANQPTSTTTRPAKATTPPNSPVHAYVTAALKAEHPRRRALVATYLGQQGRPVMMRELLQLLTDPRPEVRQAAAEALGKIGQRSPEIVQMLANLLRNSQGFVALRTAVALGKIGDARGPEYLQRQWASTKKMPAIYRKKLLESLAELGKADARSLRAALRPATRQETQLRYLGYLSAYKGGKKASAELMSKMNDSAPTTQLYAAISASGHRRTQKQAIATLKSLCSHRNATIASGAALALAEQRNSYGVDLLVLAVKSTEISQAGRTAESTLMLGRLSPELKEPKGGLVHKSLQTAFDSAMSDDLKLAAAIALSR